MIKNTSLVTLFILVLIGGFIFALFLPSGFDESSESVDVAQISECPTWQNYLSALEAWSADYNANNLESTKEEYTLAWRATLEQNNCLLEIPACPTEDSFNEYWNTWSAHYITFNYVNSAEEQQSDWNDWVTVNECGGEWLNPLADLIEQHGASGTQVS